MKRIGQGLAIVVAVMASAVLAAPPQPVEAHNTNTIWFENWEGLSNALLKVVTPEGEIEEVFAAKGTPVYRFEKKPSDGLYRYELSAATEERRKISNKIDNGRGEKAREEVAVAFYMEGAFTVHRGVIIVPEEVKEEGSEKPVFGEDSKDGDEGGKSEDYNPGEEDGGYDGDKG